ncbi:MAG TPA: hypothetical protein VF057_06805 [Thermoanaerobaculia bacterium]
MRNVLLVSVTLALTLSFAVGAVGQQEILLVDLRVEPERMERSITLFDAAVANDFSTFDSVYREAPQAEYAELHRLWTWSMNDPIGAFYGAETYRRLSGLYPAYRNYIEQYRIVDSYGTVLYPTAETRRFLLRQAVYGMVGRTDIATATPAPAPAPASAPKKVAQATVVETPKPIAVVAEKAPVVVEHAPAPATVSVVETVPVAPRPQIRVAPAPAVAAVAAEESVRGAVRRNEADRGALSRSIFLIIAGLLGIGMMTVMLQAPRDEQPKSAQ